MWSIIRGTVFDNVGYIGYYILERVVRGTEDPDSSSMQPTTFYSRLDCVQQTLPILSSFSYCLCFSALAFRKHGGQLFLHCPSPLSTYLGLLNFFFLLLSSSINGKSNPSFPKISPRFFFEPQWDYNQTFDRSSPFRKEERNPQGENHAFRFISRPDNPRWDFPTDFQER